MSENSTTRGFIHSMVNKYEQRHQNYVEKEQRLQLEMKALEMKLSAFLDIPTCSRPIVAVSSTNMTTDCHHVLFACSSHSSSLSDDSSCTMCNRHTNHRRARSNRHCHCHKSGGRHSHKTHFTEEDEEKRRKKIEHKYRSHQEHIARQIKELQEEERFNMEQLQSELEAEEKLAAQLKELERQKKATAQSITDNEVNQDPSLISINSEDLEKLERLQVLANTERVMKAHITQIEAKVNALKAVTTDGRVGPSTGNAELEELKSELDETKTKMLNDTAILKGEIYELKNAMLQLIKGVGEEHVASILGELPRLNIMDEGAPPSGPAVAIWKPNTCEAHSENEVTDGEDCTCVHDTCVCHDDVEDECFFDAVQDEMKVEGDTIDSCNCGLTCPCSDEGIYQEEQPIIKLPEDGEMKGEHDEEHSEPDECACAICFCGSADEGKKTQEESDEAVEEIPDDLIEDVGLNACDCGICYCKRMTHHLFLKSERSDSTSIDIVEDGESLGEDEKDREGPEMHPEVYICRCKVCACDDDDDTDEPIEPYPVCICTVCKCKIGQGPDEEPEDDEKEEEEEPETKPEDPMAVCICQVCKCDTEYDEDEEPEEKFEDAVNDVDVVKVCTCDVCVCEGEEPPDKEDKGEKEEEIDEVPEDDQNEGEDLPDHITSLSSIKNKLSETLNHIKECGKCARTIGPALDEVLDKMNILTDLIAATAAQDELDALAAQEALAEQEALEAKNKEELEKQRRTADCKCVGVCECEDVGGEDKPTCGSESYEKIRQLSNEIVEDVMSLAEDMMSAKEADAEEADTTLHVDNRASDCTCAACRCGRSVGDMKKEPRASKEKPDEPPGEPEEGASEGEPPVSEEPLPEEKSEGEEDELEYASAESEVDEGEKVPTEDIEPPVEQLKVAEIEPADELPPVAIPTPTDILEEPPVQEIEPIAPTTEEVTPTTPEIVAPAAAVEAPTAPEIVAAAVEAATTPGIVAATVEAPLIPTISTTKDIVVTITVTKEPLVPTKSITGESEPTTTAALTPATPDAVPPTTVAEPAAVVPTKSVTGESEPTTAAAPTPVAPVASAPAPEATVAGVALPEPPVASVVIPTTSVTGESEPTTAAAPTSAAPAPVAPLSGAALLEPPVPAAVVLTKSVTGESEPTTAAAPTPVTPVPTAAEAPIKPLAIESEPTDSGAPTKVEPVAIAPGGIPLVATKSLTGESEPTTTALPTKPEVGVIVTISVTKEPAQPDAQAPEPAAPAVAVVPTKSVTGESEPTTEPIAPAPVAVEVVSTKPEADTVPSVAAAAVPAEPEIVEHTVAETVPSIPQPEIVEPATPGIVPTKSAAGEIEPTTTEVPTKPEIVEPPVAEVVSSKAEAEIIAPAESAVEPAKSVTGESEPSEIPEAIIKVEPEIPEPVEEEVVPSKTEIAVPIEAVVVQPEQKIEEALVSSISEPEVAVPIETAVLPPVPEVETDVPTQEAVIPTELTEIVEPATTLDDIVPTDIPLESTESDVEEIVSAEIIAEEVTSLTSDGSSATGPTKYCKRCGDLIKKSDKKLTPEQPESEEREGEQKEEGVSEEDEDIGRTKSMLDERIRELSEEVETLQKEAIELLGPIPSGPISTERMEDQLEEGIEEGSSAARMEGPQVEGMEGVPSGAEMEGLPVEGTEEAPSAAERDGVPSAAGMAGQPAEGSEGISSVVGLEGQLPEGIEAVGSIIPPSVSFAEASSIPADSFGDRGIPTSETQSEPGFPTQPGMPTTESRSEPGFPTSESRGPPSGAAGQPSFQTSGSKSEPGISSSGMPGIPPTSSSRSEPGIPGSSPSIRAPPSTTPSQASSRLPVGTTTSIRALDKQALAPGATISAVQNAFLSLRIKDETKDRMIKAMADELRLRAESNVWEQLLGNIARTEYDKGPPLTDFDRTELCQYLSRPKLTDEVQKKLKRNDPNADRRPSKFRGPIEVHIVRRIVPDCILVAWSTPPNRCLSGFEIFVNGKLAQRVRSPNRNTAVLHDLNLNDKMVISVIGLTPNGRCADLPANVTYNGAEETLRVTQY